MITKALSSIALDQNAGASLQTQLCLKLKAIIEAGSFKPAEPLPSSRELAKDLHVSRNTVIAAYDRLVGEGYLEAKARSGLFVTSSLADLKHLPPHRKGTLSSADPSTKSPVPRLDTPPPFRPCQPDVRLFPLALWNRMRSRSLKEHGSRILHYQSNFPAGLPALRQSLAGYLRDSRGVRCDWRQIAITTGSQQALFLLAHLLLKPGDRVLMEDPGYLGARLAWNSAGASVQPAPVDENGIVPSFRESPSPSLVYTTPSRQFPTGACLPLARRAALLDHAAKLSAWIIEDDYDSEFRYTRPPLPSLHSLDSSNRVIYLGSMSKVLFPSLRIGYLVLPDSLVDKFSSLRAVVDDHGPLIDQATLAEFISSGAFYTHIRRCRREYVERLSTFLRAAEHTAVPLVFPHTDGGMNLMGLLPPGTDDAFCSRELKSAKLDIPPASRYAIKTTKPGLLFGFTAFDHSTIRNLMRVVADSLSFAIKKRSKVIKCHQSRFRTGG